MDETGRERRTVRNACLATNSLSPPLGYLRFDDYTFIFAGLKA
jgi:hypothetical protein